MKYIRLFENAPVMNALKTQSSTIKIQCTHDVGDFDEENVLTQKTTIHYKEGDTLTLVNYYYPKTGILPKMYPIDGGGWISADDVIKHFKVIE